MCLSPLEDPKAEDLAQNTEIGPVTFAWNEGPVGQCPTFIAKVPSGPTGAQSQNKANSCWVLP